MVDSDEEIADAMAKDKNYFVIPISHNTTIAPKYLVAVTPRTGLTGHFQCGWQAMIHEDAIISTQPRRKQLVLTATELEPVETMTRHYQKDKATELAKRRGGSSTRS
jgi:hypothetical protein